MDCRLLFTTVEGLSGVLLPYCNVTAVNSDNTIMGIGKISEKSTSFKANVVDRV